MKLLRVISSMDPSMGGPCQGIRNSIPELNKIGVENEVLCLDESDSLYLKTDNFKIHALGPVRFSWSYTSKLVPWLKKNIFRFDVIIVHGLWQYHSYAVYKTIEYINNNKNNDNTYLKSPKLYIMPHGMLDPYSIKSNGKKFKAISKLLYWKLIEVNVINKADGILFTCVEELLLARKSYSTYKPKKEINLGYGIEAPPHEHTDMHEAFKKICPRLIGKPYLLFLGRIHEKKGVDIIVKAYQKLATRMALPKLVLAGPGIESSYGLKLKELIKSDSTTAGDIFLPGMLIGDQKWGAFYGCDAFILPSHQENFGIAVVEALACAQPVLISDQVNIWREIKSDGGGLVEMDNLTGVINLLNSWMKLSKKDKEKMKVKARLSYLSRFSINVYATRIKETL